jgi:hypothetical protein
MAVAIVLGLMPAIVPTIMLPVGLMVGRRLDRMPLHQRRAVFRPDRRRVVLRRSMLRRMVLMRPGMVVRRVLRAVAMRPPVAVVVPRASPVVVVPVTVEGKADQRQADHRPVSDDRHVRTLVWVDQVAGGHPTPIAIDLDVAPAVVGKTAVDIDGGAFGHPPDQRIVGVRTGPQIDCGGGVGLLRQSGRRQGQDQPDDPTTETCSCHDVT